MNASIWSNGTRQVAVPSVKRPVPSLIQSRLRFGTLSGTLSMPFLRTSAVAPHTSPKRSSRPSPEEASRWAPALAAASVTAVSHWTTTRSRSPSPSTSPDVTPCTWSPLRSRVGGGWNTPDAWVRSVNRPFPSFR